MLKFLSDAVVAELKPIFVKYLKSAHGLNETEWQIQGNLKGTQFLEEKALS